MKRYLVNLSDCTSQESESEICPSCHIHNTFLTQAESESEDDNIFCQEIEEMIITVDKNQDGKISYSEFRVEWTCYFILFPSNGFDFVSCVIWLPGKGMMWCLQWYVWLTNNIKCQKLAMLQGDVGRLAIDHSRGGPPNCQSVRKSWMFLKVVSMKVPWKGVNANG